VSLPILRRATEAGALRFRGRRCDESRRAYGDTIDIATPEWPALDFPPAPLFVPHPGTVQDRSERHRTVYAEVESNGADADQLWRSGWFPQP
jgi:hypothetical protein